MTTTLPASPKVPSPSIDCTAPAASARVAQTMAPLPAARPEAFTTSGSACRRDVRERGAEVGEGLARRGGDARRRHHVLGERLRGLDARGRRAGTGDEAALGAQPVGEARGRAALRGR